MVTKAQSRPAKKFVPKKTAPKKKTVPAKKLTAAQKLDKVGVEVIMEQVADCQTLKVIAAQHGVSVGRLHEWLDSKPEQYARARERQGDKLVADMLEIADTASEDTFIDPKTGEVKVNQEVVARSRLRVDARKWLAGKMHSKKYGDKLDLNHSGKIDLTDDQVTARLTLLLGKVLPTGG